MRLISIGKSPSCTVHLASEYVSSYHAEILLLDNGDVFLTDCDSTNGTFLNGKRITPRVEVPVRRGDRIEFDNVPLDWSTIPQIPLPDPAKVKGIYGVGKSQRNRYHLAGDSVSRYHATFKEMKNGKWFINDHSKNGTFINGNRIPANQDVLIKAKDSIVCGSVPCPNPVRGSSVPGWFWTAIGGIAATIALVFCIIKVVPGIFGHNTDPYKSVVLVRQTFALSVNFADDPIKGKSGGWYIGKNDLTEDISEAVTFQTEGTAFFVNKNGLMVTNKHVVDWIYYDESSNSGRQVEEMKTLVREKREELVVWKYLSGRISKADAEKWLDSSFEITAVPLAFQIIYPGRTYTMSSQFDAAQLVKKASDDNVDIAILQLDNQKTPEFCDYFDLSRSRSVTDLKRSETYYTVGFPYGDIGANQVDNKYEPHYGQLILAQNPTKYTLTFDKSSIGGQSGSPIYDKKHRLVGVLWGGSRLTNDTYAAPIDLAADLLKDVVSEHEQRSKFKSTNAY